MRNHKLPHPTFFNLKVQGVLKMFCFGCTNPFGKSGLGLLARDIQQIHLILGNFEWKKSLMKNYSISLKKSINTSKPFFIYVQNIWEDIIHGNYMSRFWYKRAENFLISENMHFLVIFRYLQISFAVLFCEGTITGKTCYFGPGFQHHILYLLFSENVCNFSKQCGHTSLK